MTAPTAGAARRRARARLAQAGIAAAEQEARILLRHVTGWDDTTCLVRDRDPLPDDVRLRLDALVERRAAHIPLAHLTGDVAFHGVTLSVDSRALVPRSDSEAVVDAALDLLPAGTASRIADLGTGSGCLLLAILAARPEVTGVGLDRDPSALSLARENAERLGLGDRAELAVCDWMRWTGYGTVDLIVSNPPYIRSADIAGLDPEVRNGDPRAALDGGQDGLDAYRSILALAARSVRPGTWIVLEIGADQAADVCALMDAHGFVGWGVQQDMAGRDRVVVGRQPDR